MMRSIAWALSLVSVLAATSSNAATVEGQWLEMMGSVEVGSMRFGGANDIVDAIRASDMPCDALTRLETFPGSLVATCDPAGHRYRLLPGADGEPLIAPLH